MNLAIVHRIPGRLRCRALPEYIRKYKITYIEQLIVDMRGVKKAKINPRTGSVLVVYDQVELSENSLFTALIDLSTDKIPLEDEENQEASLGWSYIGYQLFRLIQPYRLKPFFTMISAIPYFVRGLRSLVRGRMDVALLDATAIGAAIAMRDFKSASTLIMLLKTGDYLEHWAHHRTRASLASTISVSSGQVWILRRGKEAQIPYSQLKMGDKVIVRAGSMIPVDGEVVEGQALVNESSMTGEPLSAPRSIGSSVHAGTVLEEGYLIVKVAAKGEETRLQRIVQLIEESEASKAEVEIKSNAFADRIVPFNFALAGLAFAATGNPRKAAAAVSVDYSCAIKLSTPLVFLSTMKEGLNYGVFFKGGAPLESISKVDTIVFDKTGTLTNAAPKVVKIIAYNDYTEREVLKISACLEEHFPHPVAKAIVKHAVLQKVEHKEEHSEVKYIVAHGIVTLYKGKPTMIGSRHFINEDEGVNIDDAHNDEVEAAEAGYSMLYLARDGKLAGVILIDDPVREEAAEVILMLRKLGIKHVYMFTGDNRRTAERVAKQLGIDSFRGEVLPDEKAVLVKRLKDRGRRVAMVGDGMNDSPALSVADVGIAMKGGADLAQEVADITLSTPSLYPLVIARLLSQQAIKRIHYNNVAAVGINTVLMMLSIFGPLTPTLSVWLHNLTTLGISMNSMRNLMPKND